MPVADPGFPRSANPRWGGANLLFGKTFCRKLYENERNLNERGKRIPSAPLDSPLHDAEIND